ncbi:MAG: polysaccharide biosynthesis protein [Alistipes sp.]|nr:polysaccharide biosynthesis protein [Alistipes sp.]
MLEKLAKQTAVYGISTILGRFLSYLLTPIYTYIFGKAEYGIVTDIYALIPFALVVLNLGMESGYFRFAGKAEAAGGDVAAAKRRLFATTWGITSLAAVLFFVVITLLRMPVARVMGPVYEQNPLYIVIVAAIVMFDVSCCIPFSRLREEGRAMRFVALKLFNIVLQVVLALAFYAAGLFDTPFGVGWVIVANLTASIATWIAVLAATEPVFPRIDPKVLAAIFVYSLPLLISGIAGTANELIDRQLIKYLVPEDSMAELGVYGAIAKIAVVMTLFTQMYRFAAEPFFLSNFRKEDFLEMNAAAMKYYVIVSMGIFIGIGLFKDLFALIVGPDFRQGIYILPLILGANVLAGIWLNLSFWYKREERTSLALWVTFSGLAAAIAAGTLLIPRYGYYGAAWGRLISEAVMVAVSLALNRLLYPTPYDLRGIALYMLLGTAIYFFGAVTVPQYLHGVWMYASYAVLLAMFGALAVWREKIDVRGLMLSLRKTVLRR